MQDIVEKSTKVDDFPFMGRIVSEIDNPNIRELIVYSCRLIYEITASRIEVIALIHGKQDFSSTDIGKSKEYL